MKTLLKFTVLLPVYIKNELPEFKRSLKSITDQSLKPKINYFDRWSNKRN